MPGVSTSVDEKGRANKRTGLDEKSVFGFTSRFGRRAPLQGSLTIRFSVRLARKDAHETADRLLCQPVASIISASVAPLDRFISPITSSLFGRASFARVRFSERSGLSFSAAVGCVRPSVS